MKDNQFSVYQLKNIPENRYIRFRSYSVLQEQGIQVQYDRYDQVYFGWMQPTDGPELIRKRLEKKLPRTFHGHSISISDVFVLNKENTMISYYVEKTGFSVIADFIKNVSAGDPVSLGATNFHIKGKKGSWLAFDSIFVEDQEFFLMEHEIFGKEATWVVVDKNGVMIVDNVFHGFDANVLQQIRNYLKKPSQIITAPVMREVPSGRGQIYNMIDGQRNNMLPKGKDGRVSVLARLRQKQAKMPQAFEHYDEGELEQDEET